MGSIVEKTFLKDFNKSVNIWKAYRAHTVSHFNGKFKLVMCMDDEKQLLLEEYSIYLLYIDKAIEVNSSIAKKIARWGYLSLKGYQQDVKEKIVPTVLDVYEIHDVMMQIAVEWSEAGKEQRELYYGSIVREIKSKYPHNRWSIKVLVPGSRLNRLVYEISEEEYSCEGVESSMLMIMAAYFIVMCDSQKQTHDLYPWLHASYYDRLQKVTFPDVIINKAADERCETNIQPFLEGYGKGDYDCIATCAFQEDAEDVVHILLHIYNTLKPGGIWVNVGEIGLSNDEFNTFIPPYDLTKSLIQNIGFRFLKEEELTLKTPARGRNGVLSITQKSMLFVCEKPLGDCQQIEDCD